MTITPNSSPPVLEEGEMKMGSSQSQPCADAGPCPRSQWRPISEAKKNGVPILAVFRNDIYPGLRPERPDLAPWNGVAAVIRHRGLAADGFDVGWAIAAPVGNGGFPDEWIAGWIHVGDEVVHEQVSPPIRADLETASLEDRAALREEVERLHERLEDNRVYDMDGNRKDVPPGSIPDGIECRDETIRQQRERITELFERARAAEEDLKVIGRASAHVERSFGGPMSEVTRVLENITRVARMHEGRALSPTPATKDDSHD